MKKALILLLVSILVLGQAACANKPADNAITGAIHRVEYGDNAAYLFGTFHVGHEYWFPLADVVEDALRRSDVVALEIEEIAMGSKAIQQAAETMRYLPDGLTWTDYLPEDAYYHLTEVLETWEISYVLMRVGFSL